MKRSLLIIFLLLASSTALSAEYCFNKVEVTSDYIFVSQSTSNNTGTIEYIEEQSLFLTTDPGVLNKINQLDGERFCVKGRVRRERKEIELYVPCEGFSRCRRVEFIQRTIFATDVTQK